MEPISVLHVVGSPSVTRMTTVLCSPGTALALAHASAPPRAAYIGVCPLGVFELTASTRAFCCGSPSAGAVVSGAGGTSGWEHASTLHTWSLQPAAGASS